MVDETKSKILCVRVTPQFYAKLEKAANLDRRTIADYVRILLEDTMKKKETQ